jgi:hypothetical protein
MLPTQHQQYEPISDLELELQRRGQARHRSVEEREDAARGLEVLGYATAARRLRELNDCLTRRAQVKAVPADERRPLKSPPGKTPILMVVPDPPAQAEDDPRDVAMRHAAVGLDAAARVPGLSRSERAAFARLRALASGGPDLQPAG